MKRGEAKKLSWEEYKDLAAVTESPNFHYENFKVTTLHGIIGIQTESAELLEAVQDKIHINIKNVREEIGDILWYISAVVRAENIEINIQQEEFLSIYPIVTRIQILAGILVDVAKKGIFYGKEPDMNLVSETIKILIQLINKICSYYDWDIEEVMAENIKKLKKRYPEQFTSYYSEVRLDKNENLK